MTHYLITSGDKDALHAGDDERLCFVPSFKQSYERTQRHQCRKLELWLWERYRFRVPVRVGYYWVSPSNKLLPLYKYYVQDVYATNHAWCKFINTQFGKPRSRGDFSDPYAVYDEIDKY